jgi:LemA protein
MTIIFILLAIIVIAVIWFIAIYNGFVSLRTRAKEAWADIDVQLKRRYDLIPNLVNTVKGYATHEREAFENVTKARTQAMSAGAPHDKAIAENELTGALGKLFALAEAYPDLKANQNFMELQRELSDTENKIQAARRFYNANVRDLNIKIETVPSNIIANMFKFEKMEFFELEGADEAARNPVEVKF